MSWFLNFEINQIKGSNYIILFGLNQIGGKSTNLGRTEAGGGGGDLGPPTGFDGVRIVSKFFVTTGAIGTIILGLRKLHIYPKLK